MCKKCPRSMPELGSQDPVTEALTDSTHNHDVVSDCCCDPLVDMLMSRENDLAPLEDAAGSHEQRHESQQLHVQVEEKLRLTQQENDKLKEQSKQQFEDLGELEVIMDQLEAQVGGHEAIIKQQGFRIQEQEQTITQLNSRLQQFVQALVLNTRM